MLRFAELLFLLAFVFSYYFLLLIEYHSGAHHLAHMLSVEKFQLVLKWDWNLTTCKSVESFNCCEKSLRLIKVNKIYLIFIRLSLTISLIGSILLEIIREHSWRKAKDDVYILQRRGKQRMLVECIYIYMYICIYIYTRIHTYIYVYAQNLKVLIFVGKKKIYMLLIHVAENN